MLFNTALVPLTAVINAFKSPNMSTIYDLPIDASKYDEVNCTESKASSTAVNQLIITSLLC
jgi:hypothetical protein